MNDSIFDENEMLSLVEISNQIEDEKRLFFTNARRKVGVQLARKKLAGIGSIPYLCHRISITDQNQLPMYMQTSTYQQVNHYYPYGGLMGESTDGDVQRFKYNGKELERMHGLDWYDYGARYLDAALGRWSTIDPMAEKYYNLSPYNYCGNNPIKFVDPDGLKPTEEEAARIADHVYDGNVELIGGWKVSSLQIEKVVLKDDNSGFKSALYERTIDGVTEYVYATAGTDFDSLEDWKNNILQFVGASKQYEISMQNASILSDKIDKELTFVGHSLGGGLAAANAFKTGRSAMTFNAAWVSPLTITPWNRKNARIDAFVHVRDELNIFQQTQMGVRANGNIHWRSKNRSVLGHSIENFYQSSYEAVQKKAKDAQLQYILNNNNSLWP